MDTRETPQRVNLPVAKAVGGAAPQDRRCRRILESGHQCRDWSVRGWDLCSRHGRYRGTSVERPIEVPLLEDDAAVTFVLSQAVRALAWGTIPPANGRAVIAGCKAVTDLLKLRVKAAEVEAKKRERAEPPEPLVTDVVEDRGDLYSRQMSQEEITRAWLEERAEKQRVSESAGQPVSRLASQQVSEFANRQVSQLASQQVSGIEESEVVGVPEGAEVLVETMVAGAEAVPVGEAEGLVESHPSQQRAWMGHPGVVDGRGGQEVLVETMVASAEDAPTLSSDKDGSPALTPLWRAIEADAVGEPEVEADAEWEPVVQVEHPPRFRDLKDRWERAARRFGESLADLKVPRKDEDREMWKAALRRPWDGQYPSR